MSATVSSPPAAATHDAVLARRSPASGPHRRRPELDGIRGVAILLVLFGHWFAGPAAASGVTLFFGLSGYLITGILLAERERTGRINLRRFYGRRMTRLGPPLVVVVVATMVVSAFAGGATWSGALASITWTTNYASILGVDVYPFSHTWSLAVEEQFYLVWPVAFLALMSRGRPQRWLIVILGVLMAWRFVVLASGHTQYGYEAFEAAGTAILAGCLIALTGWTLTNRWLVLAAFGSLLLAVSVALLSTDSWMWIPFLVTPSVALILAGSEACRFLRWRWLGFCGVVSYSAYLWHVPFGFLLADGDGFSTAGSMLGTALGVLAYFVVERPLMRWRARRSSALAGGRTQAPLPVA